ncbi:hypothetical protein CRG98_039490 [Punica granatum]|uniref:Uncharacterized protein n=1 Tax=Punica granatum TaxID=22663 RepID=A0A2I0I804_PUNGR|nr:hypothetical protein CRG98_039490 [Punica granatum]
MACEMAKSVGEMPESASQSLANVTQSHPMSVSDEKSAPKGSLNSRKVFPKVNQSLEFFKGVKHNNVKPPSEFLQIGVDQWSYTLIGLFMSKTPDFGKKLLSLLRREAIVASDHAAKPGEKASTSVVDICAADAPTEENTCATNTPTEEDKGRAKLREVLNKEKRDTPTKGKTLNAADIIEEVETRGNVASLDDEWDSVAKKKEVQFRDTSKLRSATMEVAQKILKVQGKRKSRTGKGGKPPKLLS